MASTLAHELGPRDVVLLEGQLGAGKSTFARAALAALGAAESFEGSPTFAIAHEYKLSQCDRVAAHLDLYRLRSEADLEAAGIHAYLWERDLITFCEWTTMFPEFRSAVLGIPAADSRRVVWIVELEAGKASHLRNVRIERHAA